MFDQLISFQEKLGAKPDPFEKDEFGFTHLHWAAMDKNAAAAGHLLRNGADAHVVALNAFGEFTRPTQNFRQRMSRFGLGFNCTNYWGVRDLTPLHIAASTNSVEIMKLLYEHGAIFESAGYPELNPVHCALCGRSDEALHALLRNGFGVDDKGRDSRTMLHWIAMHGADSRVAILLGGQFSSFAIELHDPVGAARTMIEEGASIAARDERGNSPLHLAAATDKHEVAEVYLGHGAKVDAHNYSGATPLHLAAWFNSPKTANLLIERGAHIDSTDTAGNTPLHIATADDALDTHEVVLPDGTCCSRRGKNLVLGMLVENGADVIAKNVDGKTPLGIAESKRGSDDTFKLLNDRIGA